MEAINRTCDKSKLISHEPPDTETANYDSKIMNDHDYLADPSNRLSEFCRQIVIYIAGFVVSKLNKELKCEHCLERVISFDKYSSLQLKKDKGGLCYPSKSVISICEICEKNFRTNISLQNKNLFHQLIQECLKKL